MARRLACVFAHPDDETFAVGGTLARYAAAGVTVDLFCVTDGDAGRSSGVPISSRAALGTARRSELAEAARILGVSSVESAGEYDGTLHQTDPDSLIGRIVGFLRRARPHVVITFGPEGAPTGHRDHRAVSRATTAAFFLAGIPTENPEQLADGVAPHRGSRLFYTAWEPPPPGAELTLRSVPATASIDVRAFRDTIIAAFRAHRTQRDFEQRFMTEALKDVEQFALAAGVPQPSAMVTDLFDGLPAD
ncbi:MAG TPA: PIG-L deacetylase family protein [Gemmatimonadaceae bacterium]